MLEENAIEIRGMSKSFKVHKDKPKTLKEMITRRRGEAVENEVLKNISLDIKKGETVVLIGTNGAGKSTLLKLMTKILYPTSGTVTTDGKLTSLLELGAGFHPDFTGRENIYFNAAVFGMTRKEIESRIDQIIEFSELGSFIDEPVRTYSSGMYMRLAFSIAINVDADILLIDEILAVGDQHFQNKCFEKLEELRDSNTTVVIVSHSLESVKHLCTRAVWLYKGHLQLDGAPAYVISEYLKQSAIDNKEKAKELHSSGTMKTSGQIFSDHPRSFSDLSKKKTLECRGWSVCNGEDSVVEIWLDGKKLDKPFSIPREDVFEIYKEEYAGMIEPETIGWGLDVDLSDLEEGEHVLETVLRCDDQTVDRKKVRINVHD